MSQDEYEGEEGSHGTPRKRYKNQSVIPDVCEHSSGNSLSSDSIVGKRIITETTPRSPIFNDNESHAVMRTEISSLEAEISDLKSAILKKTKKINAEQSILDHKLEKIVQQRDAVLAARAEYGSAFITEINRLAAAEYNANLILSEIRQSKDQLTNELEGKIKLLNDYSRRLRWRKEREQSIGLDRGRLFFVNRNDATDKLLEVHYDCFNRWNGGGHSEPQIAFIDDVYGMGKTEFAYKYINNCKERIDQIKNREFCESICRARTVDVKLPVGSLIDPLIISAEECDAVLKKAIFARIEYLASKGDLFGDFKSLIHAQTSCELISRIISETGTHLFIVLDEMGDAFSCKDANGPNVFQRRVIFFEFCSKVLSPWILKEGLYFVILGRGDIFDFVAATPSGSENLDRRSPFDFRRISLSLIHRDYVKIILTETPVGNNAPGKFLKDLYELHSDSEFEEATEKILKCTNGHPRSMLKMFRHCVSKKHLLDYKGDCNVGVIQVWIDRLIRYRSKVLDLLDCIDSGERIDMTRAVADGDKHLSWAQLANRSFIRWEGQIDNAKLFASPRVIRLLSQLLLPLREFLCKVSTESDVKYNHAANFEICCLKIFQEMFAQAQRPEVHYPQWFGGTLFGLLNEFKVPSAVSCIPKVTERGSKFANLDQSTVHAGEWNLVRDDMEKKAPMCFMPLELSASSDAFIITQVWKDGIHCLVTIGLAAKCYSTTTLRDSNVEAELWKFNRMFETRIPGEGRKAHQINILIICCTGSRAGMNNVEGKFFSRVDLKGYKNIDEAFCLDLSTPALRAKFFRVDSYEHSAVIARTNLEIMIRRCTVQDEGGKK